MNTDSIPPDEIAEQIGILADTCDNLHSASLLPMGADFHLPILRTALLELRDELRSMYVNLAGENPWTT